ncbi:unnamed protein product [Adineta steineri]|uniref:Uncharacterized protein n=2 Tax=Adineta steineri TaxID=433720 RepID=A0A814M8L1_9BILA|nr:unnamed protein product [Adineta steineri]
MATAKYRVLSIDVKCVATSYTHEDLEQAPTLEEVLQKIHPLFDATTIIVGQRPQGNIKWLKLQKDVHYSQIIDLSEWFKAYNTRFGSIK